MKFYMAAMYEYLGEIVVNKMIDSKLIQIK